MAEEKRAAVHRSGAEGRINIDAFTANPSPRVSRLCVGIVAGLDPSVLAPVRCVSTSMLMPVEPWLRGPVPGLAPVFQPIAHALMQAREDIGAALDGFPDDRLVARPAGVASVGFHLRHIAGVLDRMATYARGTALSLAQFAALDAERGSETDTVASLVAGVDAAVEAFLAQVRATPEATVFEARGVGREALPSTVLGLIVHAAEHTQRHVGQLIVTARIVRGLGAASRPP